MSDLPFGISEVRIAPLDQDGLPTDFSILRGVKEFRLTEVAPDDMGWNDPIKWSTSWSADLGVDFIHPSLLVMFGVLCRCCYGPLPKRGRCRVCVARP